MTLKKYKTLKHTADLKMKIYGQDQKELFLNAALAMQTYIFGPEESWPKELEKRELVKVQARDLPGLLVAWLSEILYLQDVNNMLYKDFDFRVVTEEKFEAYVYGAKAKANDDIKAVTYHQLEVVKTNKGYEATIIFDI